MGKREKKVIRGTATRPRLLVFRSNKHIYVQIIDDTSSKQLLHVQHLNQALKQN